ncbi:MAG: PTS fructose transporter subunit IIA [Burkholderiaceae bacterium]|nr:PTS fructose transporter subunit IIA [Burkholderiaceae bacterium]
MNNGVLIIAHAPLAHALRQCALHVFADAGDGVLAVDVHPNAPPEESLESAHLALKQLPGNVLVLTDVFGATPCNVAQRLVDGISTRLVAGVNLPMLLRALTYRGEPLDVMLARAMAGGAQGVMQVTAIAPQNQSRRTTHDQERHDHQQ